jgi:hypothetical protein
MKGTHMREEHGRRVRRSWRLATMVAVVASIGIPVGVPAHVRAADAEYQEINFTVLSGFDYDLPDPLDPSTKLNLNQVPAKVKGLHGKKVSVRGFMLPLDIQADGVSLFMLNASFDMCYFGAPVRMNEWIMVRMKPGKKATFSHLAFRVSGVLEVGEELKNGRVQSLYRMQADTAEIAQ